MTFLDSSIRKIHYQLLTLLIFNFTKKNIMTFPITFLATLLTSIPSYLIFTPTINWNIFVKNLAIIFYSEFTMKKLFPSILANC